MKHSIYCISGTALLLLAAWGCRRESDVLMSYDYNEGLLFDSAQTSFAAKFNIIWNGMNQNYPIWDYEAEHGIDWDDVYDTYYPKFQALDQRGEDQTVTDAELDSLMREFLNPLHDGHFAVKIKNHKTGSNIICFPSRSRVSLRDDYNTVQSNTLNLDYYADPANGETETDAEGKPIVKVFSTMVADLIKSFSSTPGMGYQWVLDKISELEALSEPTDLEAFKLQQLMNLKAEFLSSSGMALEDVLIIYNYLQAQYAFLGVPGFGYIDPVFNDNGISISYALLKGNIAYLRITSFALLPYLDENRVGMTFNMGDPDTRQLVMQVKAVWQEWFDSVQTLHKAGTLGGVIIDVRGNGGGFMGDSKYVVGALVPGNYIHFSYQRFKRGTGRYDYSPLMEGHVTVMPRQHEDVTDVPVVALVNCMSASMAETTSLCVKTLPKGKVIGKRSYGALNALSGNDYSSYNYSGYVGVDGVTPVFCRIPSMALFSLDGNLIESEGIIPDIEVDFDAVQFQTNGKDTQLDCALQFIRNGL